jgi:hypothetical protein
MKQPSIRQPIEHRRKSLLPMIFKLPSLPLGNLVSSCLVFTLVACGGGGGSGGSNSGQAPDPVVVDLPIAYIQRPIPVDDAELPVFPDVFAPAAFNPGGELYLKARATTQAEVVNISRCAFEPSEACSSDSDLIQNDDYDPQNPNYDVKDVSVSEDGKKLVFALHEPDLNPDDDEGPTWNIWEYELETKKLARVIRSEFEREKGDDVSPRYLPDGNIIFSSNRQKRSKEILLDEGRPQFGAVTTQNNDIIAFNLHGVRADGNDIQQLTYNQSHDIQPSVMLDGRVLFSRWKGTARNERLSFYTSNPDGSDTQRYFGDETLNQEPGDNLTEAPRLLRPQVMPDGRIAAIYFQNEVQLGGDMVVVDGRTAIEGDIEKISLRPVDISTGRVPLSGRFASLSPLYDRTNRLLVSWSQCRLLETATERLQPCLATLFTDLVAGESGIPIEGYTAAPPFYGLWIYSVIDQTQLPVVLAEAGKIFTEAISLGKVPTCTPGACAAGNYEPINESVENAGLLHIRSVYDFDGTFNNLGAGANSLDDMTNLPIEDRPARFVRITKAVSVPDADTLNDQSPSIYGRCNNCGSISGIQEILGYAPIEPDGSVKVRVPADVAFSLEILDAKGRQISREHTTKLQVRSGEIMVCNGCHEPGSRNPHGRRDLEAAPIPAPNLNAAIATLSVDLDQPSSYDNLPYPTPDDIVAPTTSACRDNWHPLCRIVINYEYHIQPLWELEHNDAMEVSDPDLGMIVSANTCIGCHSSKDSNGVTQVPAAQLDLSREKMDAQGQLQDDVMMKSYLQLTARHVQQFINNQGVLSPLPVCEIVDQYDSIDECVIVRDEEGVPTCDGVANCQFRRIQGSTELELDADNNPIPQLATIGAVLDTRGANDNRDFFNKFENNGSHMGFLNAAELKLLSEWLDTNGRYYTNPFELAIPN